MESLKASTHSTLSAARLPAERFPPVLGFVPRPYDRFTFVEDEKATGLLHANVFPE